MHRNKGKPGVRVIREISILQKFEQTIYLRDMFSKETGGILVGSFDWTKDYLDRAQIQALENIRTKVENLMREPFHLHFSDHSVGHSDRVMGVISKVLWSNLDTSKRLNGHELFVLLLATYLHDIGMQWTFSQSKEKYVEVERATKIAYDDIRKSHADRSAMMIKATAGFEKVPAPDLGIKASRVLLDVAHYVAKLVESHQGAYEIKPKCDDFSGEVLRLDLLCALLRIADTLDCDHNRVEMDKLCLYEILPESKLHWWTHHYVKSVRLDSGRIYVSFAFPETLSPPISEFFVNRVTDKIREELDLHKDVLWDNRVFLTLDTKNLPSTSFQHGMAKLPPPRDLLDHIDKILKETAEKEPLAEKRAFAPETRKVGRDWISYWGFQGNPWVDLPTSFKKEDFVETKSLQKIFDEIRGILKGKKGQIQLLVAERGMGKTTFFESLLDVFPYEEFDIAIINIGENLSEIRNARELSTLMFSRVYRHMKGVMPKKFEPRLLKDAIGEYHIKRPIICFDNLDRFDRPDEIEIISQFFREAQAILQTLGKKALVIVSCSPEWDTTLQNRDLGYLGHKTRWFLKSFNVAETRELIEKKAGIAGKAFDEVFDIDSISLINSMAKGNPRRILRRCHVLCEVASTRGAKIINRKFIQESYSKKTEKELAKLMWDLAAESDEYKRALASLYYFHETTERGDFDSDVGWNVFLQICDSPLAVSQIEKEYLVPLNFVAKRVSRRGKDSEDVKSLKLRPPIARYVKKLEGKGLTAEDFVSFFRATPVHPKEFDPEILRQVKNKSLPEEVVWYSDGAREYYRQTLEENIFPAKAIELCWKTVEYLIKANLILRGRVKEGALSDDKLGEDRYFDQDFRLRRKRPSRLTAEARGLIGMFRDMIRDKDIYVHSMDQIHLLMRKREKLLEAPMKRKAEALQHAANEAQLCRVALPHVYAELVSLLI